MSTDPSITSMCSCVVSAMAVAVERTQSAPSLIMRVHSNVKLPKSEANTEGAMSALSSESAIAES